MNSNRALVTGGTGFVGSNLCRRLLNEGFKVDLIVRPQSQLDTIENMHNAISIHIHDGSTANIMDLLKKAQPDIVFHLASLFMGDHKPEDIENIIHSNITFGVQLVEAMIATGCRYLVNTGTSWQHYNCAEYNPVCLYAATKQAYEDILKFFTEAKSLRLINLKLFDTYGPNDRRPKLFSLLRDSRGKRNPLFMSNGEQYVDLVYIDDVVDAFLAASNRIFSETFSATENYAVTSGKPYQLKTIAQIYSECTGHKLNICWGRRPYRMREVMVPWNKGIILPGWRAKIDLPEGIKMMEGIDSA